MRLKGRKRLTTNRYRLLALVFFTLVAITNVVNVTTFWRGQSIVHHPMEDVGATLTLNSLLSTASETLPPHPAVYLILSADNRATRTVRQSDREMAGLLKKVNAPFVKMTPVGVDETKAWVKEGRFRLKNNVSLVDIPSTRRAATAGRYPQYSTSYLRPELVYKYKEAATLLSHFKAIQQAYHDGHDYALMLEENSKLDAHFIAQIPQFLALAPPGWRILQFATNHASIAKQGRQMTDPYISWQPYHWGSRAYLIRREGMEDILNQVYAEGVWTLSGDAMLMADEVLYTLAGDAYTSTRLVVDSVYKAAKPADAPVPRLEASQLVRSETLLLLMNIQVQSVAEIEAELRRIRQDNTAVCRHHETCEWEIQVLLPDALCLEAWVRATANFTENIQFHNQILPPQTSLNKFAYLATLVQTFVDYDIVLFKDNDQRLAGFPWVTFLQQRGKATMAAPLRVAPHEAMNRNQNEANRQWIRLHDSQGWAQPGRAVWSSELMESMTPVEVPLLEMYFVVMDGEFAHWFFSSILTPEYCNQTSSWGPDLMWCPAAKEYSPDRPSCHLVPVVSTHEDTIQQAVQAKANSATQQTNHLAKFRETQPFARWVATSKPWRDMIGGNSVRDVEAQCRRKRAAPVRARFDLGVCARTITTASAKKAADEPKAFKPGQLQDLVNRIREKHENEGPTAEELQMDKEAKKRREAFRERMQASIPDTPKKFLNLA